ncbi:hypothetical protein GMI69_03595 [Eggerthellaceae bacterium zg-887]|uniref:hypothetical protein n=1 Tax=Xiamenia xianingshaonis TaxID=2682776 RepID=UPI001408D572|nr:hypothetical protein [Xiamenia xianingshaonis]NHM15756.1 hypothetical protein [Xiamenia xianingshaonis]
MNETEQINASLNRMRVVCMAARIGLMICLVPFALLTILSIVLLCSGGVVPFGECLISTATALLMTIILVMLIGLMKTPAKGISPFSRRSCRTLFVVACCAAGVFLLTLFEEPGRSYAVTDDVFYGTGTAAQSTFLNIDLKLLLFALMMFSFWAVFRYGTLLQRLSDENESEKESREEGI